MLNLRSKKHNNFIHKLIRMRKYYLGIFILIPLFNFAQKVDMTNMSFWKNSGKTNWSIVKSVKADINVEESISTEPGTGVMVNQPEKGNNANLESILEHGDADISFDFMMAKHSNSGFYLQGRYEVQLMDSWGVINPHTGDCGGIYKRRRFIKDANDKMQEYLWEGHAPRINACLSPGLWQHMEIQFRAPKFDATGKKIANAKVLLAKMNGVIIQENVEMTGPTGGPISETEVALGPIMIQGDHGKVAFRNMSISNLSGKPAFTKDIEYMAYYGAFKEPKDFITKRPDKVAKLEKFTWEASTQPNDFAVIYKSKLVIPEAGKHLITFQLGGKYYVKINGKEVLPDEWTFTNDKRKVDVDLPAGEVPMEITVYKTDGWMQPIMAVWIAGPNFREVPLHTLGSVLAGAPNDPILLDAKQPIILRSFSDINKDGKKLKRITHGVNVGHPDKLHYTYDLDNGALAQIWKGEFLDTSPMWDNRGDGSSRPRGLVLTLDNIPPVYSQTATIPANFKTLGYSLDQNELPTFKYKVFNSEIIDQIVIANSKFFTRIIKNKSANPIALSFKIATGKNIEKINESTYQIDEAYFVKVDGAKIETIDGNITLVKSLDSDITYSILW